MPRYLPFSGIRFCIRLTGELNPKNGEECKRANREIGRQAERWKWNLYRFCGSERLIFMHTLQYTLFNTYSSIHTLHATSECIWLNREREFCLTDIRFDGSTRELATSDCLRYAGHPGRQLAATWYFQECLGSRHTVFVQVHSVYTPDNGKISVRALDAFRKRIVTIG